MFEKNELIHVDRKKNRTLHGTAARIDLKQEVRNNDLSQTLYEQDGETRFEPKSGPTAE